MKIKTGVVGHTKCVFCGEVIANIVQYDDGEKFTYEKENLDCRYIDKFGFERNLCKSCME